MKKRICFILSFILVISCMSNRGHAKAEVPVLEKEYSVLFSSAINTNAAYIKDTAERQNAKKITEDSVEYVAVQLLEVREYSDGVTEKDYAITKLAEPRDSGTSSSFSRSWGSHSLNLTMYYTVRGTSRNYTYNLTKIQSTVTKTGISGTTVTSGSHAYRLNKSTFKRQSFYFNNSAPTGGQVFTLATGSTSFYPSYPDALTASVAGIYADSGIDLSDGYSITINLVPKEENDR